MLISIDLDQNDLSDSVNDDHDHVRKILRALVKVSPCLVLPRHCRVNLGVIKPWSTLALESQFGAQAIL